MNNNLQFKPANYPGAWIAWPRPGTMYSIQRFLCREAVSGFKTSTCEKIVERFYIHHGSEALRKRHGGHTERIGRCASYEDAVKLADEHYQANYQTKNQTTH